MTLMCIERSQSPTHKGNFLQGGKSAVSNINQQNANHRRNSCSPPLSKNICSQQQQQQHEVPAKSNNANESRKLERSCSETGTDRRVVQSNSSRYKTELCRPFEENGSCKYGDKCQFAHGKKELRNMVRHPKYKTELCRTFHTTGLCPYGPRCHFIHNSEQNKKTLLTTLTAPTVPRQDEPRSSLGSDGEASPPSSHGGSPTETKSFDDIFQQASLSPCLNNGFFSQDALLNHFQRFIDFGAFDCKVDFYDSVNGFNDKFLSNNNNYQNGPVLDLHPVGPLTPTTPLDANVGIFRLPIFDAFQQKV
ncbi:mRNA decay activator protein ZFP36L1 [Trichonephila inaurata madagascariensis]|uniref:mRNA decay activator protein ZFP36L1 n=1 Tax=Trichonephila inaurata madagascariensis TaxID=2747483 RepID=A0A8X6YPL6_9ARAC|nr:mRNA decay activator protein ZFP36L1 [Trichonephila inaurata madagascariensis]